MRNYMLTCKSISGFNIAVWLLYENCVIWTEFDIFRWFEQSKRDKPLLCYNKRIVIVDKNWISGAIKIAEFSNSELN